MDKAERLADDFADATADLALAYRDDLGDEARDRALRRISRTISLMLEHEYQRGRDDVNRERLEALRQLRDFPRPKS
jgi:hypothetical protein